MKRLSERRRILSERMVFLCERFGRGLKKDRIY